MTKQKTQKEQIICQLCNKIITKKYKSQHMRRKHKNSEYCKVVKKGMTYNKFNKNNTYFIKDCQFFCSYCNKMINKNSKYKHFKTQLHNYFVNLINDKNDKDGQLDIQPMTKSPTKSIDSEMFSFSDNSYNSEMNYLKKKSEYIYSSSNSDFSSSFNPIGNYKRRRDSFFFRPDEKRIHDEVEEVIKRIENFKKNKKIKSKRNKKLK